MSSSPPPSTHGVMAVHAHPDDECILTGGMLVAASAAGRRTAVVTCTGGEEGEIVGAGMDVEALRPVLAEVRAGELAQALEILGVGTSLALGYRDSGMMGTDANDHPEAFWRADVDQAIGRAVAHIRAFRPAVVVVYDAWGGYGHPDHIQAHRIGLLAVEAAAAGGLYRDAGPAWVVPKLYATGLARSRMIATYELLTAAGRPSPFPEPATIERDRLGIADAHVTASLDVRAHLPQKLEALRAHATQVAADSFFFNFPDELQREAFGWETYARLRCLVPAPEQETDLFAGLDDAATW